MGWSMEFDFEKKIMGIWNVSPDSFSSICEEKSPLAFEFAQDLCIKGADVLDIGAESTRPGSTPISSEDEIERLREPLFWAKKHVNVPISLDSRRAKTIEWALSNGLTDIINDVGQGPEPEKGREDRIYGAVRDAGAGLIIMAWGEHSDPVLPFDECLKKIVNQLTKRLEFAVNIGNCPRSIMLDPGIGFGKGLDNDLRLIAEAPAALAHLGCPILIAHSRKRCLAKATALSLDALDWPTALASALAFSHGASMVRVHRPELSVIARQIAVSSSTKSQP